MRETYCPLGETDGVKLPDAPTLAGLVAEGEVLAVVVDEDDADAAAVLVGADVIVTDCDGDVVLVGLGEADSDGLVSIEGGNRTEVEDCPLPSWPLLPRPQRRKPPSAISVHVCAYPLVTL